MKNDAFLQHLKDAGEKGRDWVLREEHQHKARELKQQFEKAFTQHPHETGETYLEHLTFTVKMTSRLLYTSAVLFTHGVFPFLFMKTASRQIEKLYSIMKSRIPKQRLEEIDLNWEI